MGWTEIYPQLVKQYAAKNGSYDNNTPKLYLVDMSALLGIVTMGVVPAVDRVADVILRSDFVSADGLYLPEGNGSAKPVLGMDPMLTMDSIDARTYVSQGSGVKDAPWKRTLAQLSDTQIARAEAAGLNTSHVTYEPARSPSIIRDEQLELLHYVRQMMADYQRALDAAASCVFHYPFGVVPANTCGPFMNAIRSVCSDLDVLAENPPTTLTEDLKGAVIAAGKKSEAALVDVGKFAGKAAAELGNIAGGIAGAATEGFLEQAGLVTLAVAAIAVYVAFT